MKNVKPSFVFFGSGPVAAKSLRILSSSFHFEAIITKPSTAQEMGSILPSVPIHAVANRQELDSLIENGQFSSSAALLIDFGIILSNKVIQSFEKGIINSHFSLLPSLRGADPISFAILEGHDKTAVSLMLVVEKMDEGPILAFEEMVIDEYETTPGLTEKLIHLSARLLVETTPYYLNNEPLPNANKPLRAIDQEELMKLLQRPFLPTYTRKLTKDDGVLDWNKPANVLEREIRAFLEWPKSRCMLGSVDCIILKAHALSVSGEPGTLFVHEKKLAVYCQEGALVLDTLKPSGKPSMSSEAFLAGYRNRLDI